MAGYRAGWQYISKQVAAREGEIDGDGGADGVALGVGRGAEGVGYTCGTAATAEAECGWGGSGAWEATGGLAGALVIVSSSW